MVLYNGRLGINGLGFPGQQQQDNRRGDWPEYCKRQDRLRASVDLMELRSIKISSRIHEAVKNKDIRRLPEVEGFSGQLDENNYHRTLSNLMTVDEAHSSISMRKFDMFNQKLILELDKTDLVGDRITSCKIKVDGLSDGQPNLIPNDVVILTDPKTGVNKMTTILTIQGDYVYLKINRFGDNRMILGDAPNISFISSGLTYEYCERALERTEQDNHLKRIIFESIDGSANVLAPVKIGLEEGMFGDASERLAKLNEPQRLAVTGILAAECRPKPYILFGPPGTGKTHTLVEAIAQIYARNSRAKILFCANSNTCADQTVEKLQKVDLIRPHDIQRLAARDKTDGVNSSRIIVTTNMKSSSLMGEFEYDYVFIDEAGHAHEPESLLPICSLKRDGCLVLAGDPKQLGPVVQCKQAGEYGLGTSMFERIFKFRVYRRQLGTKNYDNRYITKLLYCYRCDPRVLAISNKLFYENELVCINETPASILRIMNLSKPVQMYHTRGTEFQFGNSTSWRNEEEAKNCADLIIRLYKMGFEPDQIGVISPYKLQAKFISKKLEEKLKESALDMLEQRFQTKRLVKRKKEKKNGDVDKPGPSMTPERFVSILRDAMDRIKLDETKTKTKDDDGETETETSEGDDEEVEYEWVYETVRRRDNWLCKINTVDAFQGNEREIIIISTVRTPSGRRKDFIDESRRFNVALSRAKWLLFTVGHKDTLDDLNNWREYMAHAASGDVPRWPRQSIFDNPFEPTGPLFKDDTY